jgi:hypothetical protein
MYVSRVLKKAFEFEIIHHENLDLGRAMHVMISMKRTVDSTVMARYICM